MPAPLQAFLAVVVMAICMSTLDTFCYLVASTLAKNFMPTRVTGDRAHYIKFSQIVRIFVLASMSRLALSNSDVIAFVLDMASLLFVLAPVYVCAAFGLPKVKNRKTDALVASGVATSALIFMALFVQGAYEDLFMISVPAFASIGITAFALFLGQRES